MNCGRRSQSRNASVQRFSFGIACRSVLQSTRACARREPMEDVSEYLRKARALSAEAFRQLHPHYFLYKHSKQVRDTGQSEQDIDYATRTLSLSFDPLPALSQLVEVRKNPDNPFTNARRSTTSQLVARPMVMRSGDGLSGFLLTSTGRLDSSSSAGSDRIRPHRSRMQSPA